MARLLQINPVLRPDTSTGRIMQEIGELAQESGWESYVAYSRGRDGLKLPCRLVKVPVGSRLSVVWHGMLTRLFDMHGEGSRLATKRFIREIGRIDPDVIHIHNVHGYFLNYRMFLDWLSRCGKPVVWTVHDCWMYTGHCYYYTAAGCNRWETLCHDCPQRREFPRSLIFDRSAQSYRKKAEAITSIPRELLTVVPVSAWLRDEMSRSFMKDFRFKVIHNGIDLSVFKPSDDAAVRREYALGKRYVILGVASIWSREKGLDDFAVLSGMIDGGSEVIVLVGVNDGQKAALPEGIVCIRRTSDVHQLAALYSCASAFVNPTWQDNYPTVNLEAIACGTPVVTYRTGGSPESVVEGETGTVVARGDVQGLLDAVRAFESADREALRRSCREYAEANFDKQERYREYLKLYEDIAVR